MSKRVYELAKDLGMSSRDVLSALSALGVVAKSHASTVDDDIIEKLRQAAEKGAFAKGAGAAKPQRPTRPQRPPLERPSAERVAPPRPQGPQPRRAEAPKQPSRQQPAAQAPGRAAPAPALAEPPAAQGDGGAVATKQRSITVHRGITLRELADRFAIQARDVMTKLFQLGEMATINQSLSDEAIATLADEYGFEVKITSPGEEEEEILVEETDSAEDLVERPPVITVMGHVDHGKTKLLDAIRETDVVAGEAGGITQHIGAYQTRKNSRAITFIDTPGHEAFTQMRARGAAATDIAVLVVAADDGVKPQTIEALNHAKAAGVPIVVAVNKIDKPEANAMQVRQQLAQQGLNPEEWGGDTIFVDVSAKAKTNLDQLLEMLLLVADVQELKANPKAPARGVALEAHLDKGRGPVATLLVQRGTLRVGDAIVCGASFCRVRAMLDEHGRAVKDAPPGTPVQVLGFSSVPDAGEEFVVVADERAARQVAQIREQKRRAADRISQRRVRLEDLMSQAREGEVVDLNIVLKADVQGSLEAIKDALEKIDVGGEVVVRVLHAAVGGITENDVSLAQASGAIIVGFNVRPSPAARELAEKESVEIRTYQVIYKLVEEMEAAVKGLLKPVFEERVTGRAQVRQVFKGSSIGTIAGSYVEEGTITRASKVRLLREGVVLADTTISSLRRFKDDVRDVQQGFECGIGIENFQDIKDGDVLETYEIREVPRT